MASSHWAGAVHPHLFPVSQEFREQSQEQSRTRKRACSKHPQDWPLSCGTQCSATPQSQRHRENEVRKVKMWQSSSWGKGEKAESCHTGSDCKGENRGPKCRGGQFPLSMSIDKGEGRETQISQQRGRSWHPPRFPCRTSTNKHAEPEPRGQICFSARFQSQGENRKDRRGRRRRGRDTHALGQIRWETAQPLTRNWHIVFYEVQDVSGSAGSLSTSAQLWAAGFQAGGVRSEKATGEGKLFQTISTQVKARGANSSWSESSQLAAVFSPVCLGYWALRERERSVCCVCVCVCVCVYTSIHLGMGGVEEGVGTALGLFEDDNTHFWSPRGWGKTQLAPVGAESPAPHS